MNPIELCRRIFNVEPPRRDPRIRITSELPWVMPIDKGVIVNKKGSFQKTYRSRGHDFDSSTPENLLATCNQVNHLLKRFGTSWALYSEAQRVRHNTSPKGSYKDPITQLIDVDRKSDFENKPHFETKYYNTFIYLPPAESRARLESMIFEKGDDDESEGMYEKYLQNYLGEMANIEEGFRSVLLEFEELNREETLTYLHSTCSEKSHRVKLPPFPMYLDSYISDSSLLQGTTPKLGNSYLKVITINGFPEWSRPAILDILNHLPIEYRWITRFIFLDKADAEKELSEIRRKWFAKRYSLFSQIVAGIFRKQQDPYSEDTHAVQMSEDAKQALLSLQHGEQMYGYYNSTIVLKDENLFQLEEAAKSLIEAVNTEGFTAYEEGVNSTEAWLGTIPGNCWHNPRHFPMGTANLSQLLPLSAVWSGPEKNKHLNAPVLFNAVTTGSTQFRYPLHIGDVGHTMVVGPTGAGKSVFLNFIAAQFRARYKNAQVFILDKDRSARVPTLLYGGDHFDIDIGHGSATYQPLADVHIPSERRWAQEWLVRNIFMKEGLTVTPDLKSEVWRALGSLATHESRRLRTLNGLRNLIRGSVLKDALSNYTSEGPLGMLLDASNEERSASDWQCFELSKLMKNKTAIGPTSTYLFHLIEKNFHPDRPSLLVLDEVWLMLKDEYYAEWFEELLRVARKMEVSIFFATQNPQDITDSKIAPIIISSCQSKVILPDPAAYTEERARVYSQSLGLNRKQIEIIASSIPKKHYYYTSPEGNRLIDLALSDLALAYVGSTNDSDQEIITRLSQQASDNYELNELFLREKGIHWAADIVSGLTVRQEAA